MEKGLDIAHKINMSEEVKKKATKNEKSRYESGTRMWMLKCTHAPIVTLHS
jgi:hypothetical protein